MIIVTKSILLPTEVKSFKSHLRFSRAYVLNKHFTAGWVNVHLLSAHVSERQCTVNRAHHTNLQKNYNIICRMSMYNDKCIHGTIAHVCIPTFIHTKCLTGVIVVVSSTISNSNWKPASMIKIDIESDIWKFYSYIRCLSRDICVRSEVNNSFRMKADARGLLGDWGTQNGNGNRWNWWRNWFTTARTHLTWCYIHYL